MRSHRNRLHLTLAGLFILALGFGGAWADTIDPGETIKDTLQSDDFSHEYTFDADEDDAVTIMVFDEDDDDDFFPNVTLFGPGVIRVADVVDDEAAIIAAFRIPRDGEYRIVVSRAGFFRRDDFDYIVSMVSSGATNDGVIAYGQTIDGAIFPDGDVDAFRFVGRDGDNVKISVEDLEARDDFRVHVDLIDPDGEVVEHDTAGRVAQIDEKLNRSGNYTIVIWGDEPDWEGGPYRLRLNAPDEPPPPPPLPTPELVITQADVSPVAPVRLQPGGNIVLGAFVENLGQATGRFWLEFWGSRTGGLTLDEFITDSEYVSGLGVLGNYSFTESRALYGIPDGPYTVVAVVDRPGMVAEADESNNRFVIENKRIVVIRPRRNVDLVIENLQQRSRPMFRTFGGTVRNTGTEDSGPFWLEFVDSLESPTPQPYAFISASILIRNLASGASLELYGLPIYINPSIINPYGGVLIDRPDSISETNETNNYQFIRMFGSEPVYPGQADVTVASVDFSPAAPAELLPGQPLTVNVNLTNNGTSPTGEFWLEFWGSKTGGLTLDAFLADSHLVLNLAPGQTLTLPLTRNLYGVPDGSYSLTVVADRLGAVADFRPANNRLTVAGKRILTIRPPMQANLVVENFRIGTSQTLQRGQPAPLSGQVRNTGTQTVGPFWVEFWASAPWNDPAYPMPYTFLRDSIFVPGLVAGETLDLSSYPAAIYTELPPGLQYGPFAIGAIVDRPDSISETNEADNYMFLSGYVVR